MNQTISPKPQKSTDEYVLVKRSDLIELGIAILKSNQVSVTISQFERLTRIGRGNVYNEIARREA